MWNDFKISPCLHRSLHLSRYTLLSCQPRPVQLAFPANLQSSACQLLFWAAGLAGDDERRRGLRMRVSYFSITSVECSLTRCTMCVPKPSRRPACRRCIICTFSKGRHANVCNGTKKKHYTVLEATKVVCFRKTSRCDLLQEKCHSLPSSVTQTSLSGSGVYPPASTMSSVTIPL